MHKSAGAGCWCGQPHEVGTCELCDKVVRDWSHVGLFGPEGLDMMDCKLLHVHCLEVCGAALDEQEVPWHRRRTEVFFNGHHEWVEQICPEWLPVA
jgi:hypothetical protein